MKKIVNPIEISEYGTSLDRQMSVDRKSIREFFTIGVVATMFFALADFIKLFMSWDAVQTEDWYFVTMLALVSAVILDVPMMIAGNTIKAYRQGLKSKKEMTLIVILAVVAFLIAFVPSIIFSIVTKDATFQAVSSKTISNVSGYVNASDGSGENAESVLVAAVYAGVIPLGTSLASLVVALHTSDPLGVKLNKIKNARARANEHLMNLNQVIAEEESLVERQNLLMAHERDLGVQFIKECYAQEAMRIQAFEEALEEKCDADGISNIIDYAQQAIRRHDFTDEMYEETAKALDAYCSRRETDTEELPNPEMSYQTA